MEGTGVCRFELPVPKGEVHPTISTDTKKMPILAHSRLLIYVKSKLIQYKNSDGISRHGIRFPYKGIIRSTNARGGIRTHGSLRNRILSPAVLARLAYPRDRRVLSPVADKFPPLNRDGAAPRAPCTTFISDRWDVSPGILRPWRPGPYPGDEMHA